MLSILNKMEDKLDKMLESVQDLIVELGHRPDKAMSDRIEMYRNRARGYEHAVNDLRREIEAEQAEMAKAYGQG